ncbi:MAG: chaperonin family protein RbcX [Alkalinema sp. CACIAM 70d]|uniref:chaperonin family protein RbcX n=1 Tax=Alkalinema pantanalense TaxID=1620705 RepID=UPI000B6DDD1E|nr:MAG: chaperonin family protein RbcX [Alkalinema sp. CACIAM 70d]
MDLKQIAKDTTKTLMSYLTYRAVRVVYEQLDETEPKRAYWLHQFASRESIKDGELFMEKLFQERQDLAFRILTVREHLAQELAEGLSDRLLAEMQQANLKQRSQQLERMTRVSVEGNHPEQQEISESEDS